MSDKKKNLEQVQKLAEGAVREELSMVERVTRDALRINREVISQELSRRVHTLINGSSLVAGAALEDESWEQISSLSQLRARVGGRFQNLKKRWLAAGFPLKQHRGEKTARYSLVEDGWIELSNWISTQGFQVRLNTADSETLFEIRDNPGT